MLLSLVRTKNFSLTLCKTPVHQAAVSTLSLLDRVRAEISLEHLSMAQNLLLLFQNIDGKPTVLLKLSYESSCPIGSSPSYYCSLKSILLSI